MRTPILCSRYGLVAFVLLAVAFLAGCATPWERAQETLRFADVSAEKCRRDNPGFSGFRLCIEEAIATRPDLKDGPYAGYAARYKMALFEIDGYVSTGRITDADGYMMLGNFARDLRQEFVAQAAQDDMRDFNRRMASSAALMNLGNSLQTYSMHQQTIRAMQPIRPFTCTQMGMFTNCY